MNRDKMLKKVIFVLCFIGIMFIWCLLNYISKDNITNRGLGDFILMTIGLYRVNTFLRDTIFKC